MYNLKKSVRRKYKIRKSKKKSRSRSKRRYRKTKLSRRNILYDGTRLEIITSERLKEIKDTLHSINAVLFSNALMLKFRHDEMWEKVINAIGKVSINIGQLTYIYNTNFESDRQMLEDKPRYVDRTVYTRKFYYTPEIEEIIMNPQKYKSVLKKLSNNIYSLLEKIIEKVESFLMYIDDSDPEDLYNKNKEYLEKYMAGYFVRKPITEILDEFEEQKNTLRKSLHTLYEL